MTGINHIEYIQMEKDKKKGKRGGFREGAGRKWPEGKTTMRKTYNIDLDLIPILDKKGNKNRFINAAIREKLEREK
jgi:hypothetical protein